MRACQPVRDAYAGRVRVKLYYEVYGSGEPTIFLLPTWSIIHSRHWKMQIPYLARHCRFVTFDGRGNGRSDRPAAGYDEREFAADALAVMEATGTGRAVIVSLSLGAQRALLLAAGHPDRVAGAVFIAPYLPLAATPVDGPSERWDEELSTYEGWAKYNRHYWLRDYRGFLEFFFSQMFTEPHSTKPAEDCLGWGLYFPLRHHFEQNLHVRHRLDRYRAGRCMDYDSARPADLAAAIASEIGREVDYRPSPPTAPPAPRPCSPTSSDKPVAASDKPAMTHNEPCPAPTGHLITDTTDPKHRRSLAPIRDSQHKKTTWPRSAGRSCMDRTRAGIRSYRPADLDALYQICLLTGDNGQDATSLYQDPQLLGHFFAAPYGLFEPSLAFVAEDTKGVGGYIVGALDTHAFQERLESKWWPGLRARYPAPPPSLSSGQLTPDQHVAHMIHHPWRIPGRLATRYPSHLHINLLPRLQASGYGRQLIKTLTAALRDQGSRGVHLHVPHGNRNAAGFYRHLGFTEPPITAAELPAPHLHLFAMDLQATS